MRRSPANALQRAGASRRKVAMSEPMEKGRDHHVAWTATRPLA
jgi:hypothetical protein